MCECLCLHAYVGTCAYLRLCLGWPRRAGGRQHQLGRRLLVGKSAGGRGAGRGRRRGRKVREEGSRRRRRWRLGRRTLLAARDPGRRSFSVSRRRPGGGGDAPDASCRQALARAAAGQAICPRKRPPCDHVPVTCRSWTRAPISVSSSEQPPSHRGGGVRLGPPGHYSRKGSPVSTIPGQSPSSVESRDKARDRSQWRRPVRESVTWIQVVSERLGYTGRQASVTDSDSSTGYSLPESQSAADSSAWLGNQLVPRTRPQSGNHLG